MYLLADKTIYVKYLKELYSSDKNGSVNAQRFMIDDKYIGQLLFNFLKVFFSHTGVSGMLLVRK